MRKNVQPFAGEYGLADPDRKGKQWAKQESQADGSNGPGYG